MGRNAAKCRFLDIACDHTQELMETVVSSIKPAEDQGTQHSSKNGGEACEIPPQTEDLLAIDGF